MSKTRIPQPRYTQKEAEEALREVEERTREKPEPKKEQEREHKSQSETSPRLQKLREGIKNGMRKTFNPTPQDIDEKTVRIKKKNDKKEIRVKALKARKEQLVRQQKLRTREQKALEPVHTNRKKRASGTVYKHPAMPFINEGDPVSNNPFIYGRSKPNTSLDPTDFLQNHPLSAAAPRPRSTSSKKGKKQQKKKPQNKRNEFELTLF